MINYQWRKGRVNIPHATSASYTITEVQPQAADTYDVVATNAAGSATSTPVVLTVQGGYAISTSALPLAGGTTTGDGNYAAGASVTVSAVPATGYLFQSWTDGGTIVSTAASYTFTASINRTLVANFQQLPQFAWRSQWFTVAEQANSAISGDDADPDGDGLSNLVEYALGLNPRAANSPTVLKSSITNGVLTATYVRSKAASDVMIVVEDSADLITWNSGTTFTSPPQVVADDGTNQTVQVSSTQSAGSPQRFLRLKVTNP